MSDGKRKLETSVCGSSKRFCETQLKHNLKCIFTWKVSGLSEARSMENVSLKSEKFCFTKKNNQDVLWNLELLLTKSSDYIKLRVKSSVMPKENIKVELFIVKASGDPYGNTFTWLFPKFHGCLITNFTRWKTLHDQSDTLLPDDVFTVRCILTKFEIYQKTLRETTETVCNAQDALDIRHSEELTELLKGDEFVDIVFELGFAKIGAHKSILAARSPVFRSMFRHDMREKKYSEVIIVDVEEDVFREMLSYIYTGKLSNHDLKFMLKLFMAADKYDVKSLKAYCRILICDSVNKDNVCDVLLVADACNEAKLSRVCMEIIDELPLDSVIRDWMRYWKTCPEILVMESYSCIL